MRIRREADSPRNGYFYNVADLANMWWFDGKYVFPGKLAPFIAMQGGWEQNSGQSYIGKIDSQVFGAQIGANVTKNSGSVGRLRFDPVADRLRLSAQRRDLQQLELSDLGESDARLLPCR